MSSETARVFQGLSLTYDTVNPDLFRTLPPRFGIMWVATEVRDRAITPDHRANFGRLFAGTTAAVVVGSLPVALVLWFGFKEGVALLSSPAGAALDIDFQRAILNSLAAAVIVSFIGIIISTIIAIDDKNKNDRLFLILLLVFVPGQISALGLLYSAKFVHTVDGGFLRGFMLYASLTLYIMPFQYLILSYFLNRIPRDQWQSIDEYAEGGWSTLYLLYRLRFSIFSAIIVGIALVVAESARTDILRADLFGFGNRFLSPLLISRFQSGGFSDILQLLQAVLYCCALFIVVRMSGGSNGKG